MAVLAIVDDLVFRAKIEHAASCQQVAVRMVAGAAPALAALERSSWTLILLDLGGATQDPRALITSLRTAAPTTPIIGFCSHVDTALRRDALAAGCTHVLPRSVFVQRLPELLKEK